MTFLHSQCPPTRALVRKSGARTLVKSVSEKSPYFFSIKEIYFFTRARGGRTPDTRALATWPSGRRLVTFLVLL